MRMADCDTDNYDNQAAEDLPPTTKGETREDGGKKETNKEDKGPLHMTQTTLDKGWSPSGISESAVDQESVSDNMDNPVGSSASPQIAECDSAQSSSHLNEDTDSTSKLTTTNGGGKAATPSNLGNVESATSPETSICAVSSTVDDDEEKECRTVSSSVTASKSVPTRRKSFDNIFENASFSGSSLLASELLKQPAENSVSDTNRKRSSSHIVKSLLGFPATGSSSEIKNQTVENEDGESQAKKSKSSGFETVDPGNEEISEPRKVNDKSQSSDGTEFMDSASTECTNNEFVKKDQNAGTNKDDSLKNTNSSLPEVTVHSEKDKADSIPKVDELSNTPKEETRDKPKEKESILESKEKEDLCRVSVVNWSKSVRQPCSDSDLVQAHPITSTVSQNTADTIESPVQKNMSKSNTDSSNSDLDNVNVETVSSDQTVPSSPTHVTSEGHLDRLVDHNKDSNKSCSKKTGSEDGHVKANQDCLSSSVKDSPQDHHSEDSTPDLPASSVMDSTQDHLSSSVQDSTRDQLSLSDKDPTQDQLSLSAKNSSKDDLSSSVQDSTWDQLSSSDKDSAQDLSISVRDSTQEHLTSSVKDSAQINASSEASHKETAESRSKLSTSTSSSSSSNLISSSSLSSSSSSPITKIPTSQSQSTHPVDSSCVTSSSKASRSGEMVLKYTDGQFECKLCVFISEQVKFEDHLFKHMEDQTLRCDDCSAYIYSISAWHQHLQERHEGERVLPTDICEIINQVKTTGTQKYSLKPFVRLVGEDKPSSLVAKMLSSDQEGQKAKLDSAGYLEFTFVNKEYFCLKCAKKSKDKEIFRFHIWAHTHSPESTYCCCTALTRESCEVVGNILQLISNMNQSPIAYLPDDEDFSKEKVVICRVRKTDLKLETVFRKPSEIKNLYLSTSLLGNRDIAAERSAIELSDRKAVKEFPKSLVISAKDSETPKLKETVIVENPQRAGTDLSTYGSSVNKGCEKFSNVNSLVNSRSIEAKGLKAPIRTTESNNSFEPDKKKFRNETDLSKVKIKREPGEDLLLADINQKILNIKKEVKEFASLTDMLCDMSNSSNKILSPLKTELSPCDQNEVLDLRVCSSVNSNEESRKALSSNSSAQFPFGNIDIGHSKTLKTPFGSFGSSLRSLMNSEPVPRNVEPDKRGAFYRCGFNGCQFASMNSIEFRSHLENAHKYMTAYPCAHCGHMATGEDSLLRHMQSHTVSKVFLLYKCSFIGCRFGTNLLHEFREHNEILHAHETSFKCLNCSAVFYELSNLVSHLKTNLLKFIQCPHCSVKDRNRQAVLAHISEAHPGKPKQIVVTSRVVCREKQGEVINASPLTSKHPIRPFDPAKSIFPRNEELEILEARLKTNNIPPALKLSLDHHKMVNSSELNSKSEYLPFPKDQRQQFKELTDFYIHSCKLCKYSTNQPHLLEEHMKNYHPSFLGDVIKPQIPDFSILPTSQKDMLYNFKLDPPKSTPGFENRALAKAGCHLCPVAYKHVQQLKSHVRVKHPECSRLDFYKCIHCNAKSTSKEYLVTSCKKRHPNKEFHLTRVQEVLERPKKKNSEAADIIVNHNQESGKTRACEHGCLPPCFQCDLRNSEKDLSVMKHWKNHLFGNQPNEDTISEKEKPFVCTVFKNMVKPTKVQTQSPILTVPSAKSALPKIAFKPKSKSKSSSQKKKKPANADIDGSDFLPPCEIGSQTLDSKLSVLYTRNRKWNRCKCCQFTTDHVATIHHHILDCHLKLYLWTCPYCDLKSIKKQNIIQHCLHFHETKKPGAKFENQDWNKHIRSILNLLPKNTSASTFTKQTFIISGPSSESPNCYRLATEPLSIPASLTKPNRPTVVKLSNGVYKCSICRVKGFIEWQVQRHIETEHWLELRETEGNGGMSNMVLDFENHQSDITDSLAGASDNFEDSGIKSQSSGSIGTLGSAGQPETHHDDIELSSLNNPSSKDEEMKAMAQKIIGVSPGILKCPFCTYQSRLRTCVKCHIWSQHMMLKRKRCKHCSFASWFDSGIEAHMATEHPRLCFGGSNESAKSGYTVLVEEPDGTWKEQMVNFVRATNEMLSRKRPNPESDDPEEIMKKPKKAPHPNQYTYRKSPHPNQYTKKSPQPNQYTKKTPHPNQYTKKSPQPNQYTKKSPQPNQYTKKPPQPNQHTKKSPHPNQYTYRKSPHPNQYTKKSPQPNQYTKKSPQPNQYTKKPPQPNQYTKKSPHPNQYTYRKSPHPNQYTKKSPQPNQYTKKTPHPNQYTYKKSPHPNQYTKKLSESLDDSSGVLNLSSKTSNDSEVSRPGVITSSKLLNAANSSKSNKSSKPGLVISPKFFKMNKSGVINLSGSPSSPSTKSDQNSTAQNKLNVINVPKFKARDSSASFHEGNSGDEISDDALRNGNAEEETNIKNIFSRLLGKTEESSQPPKQPSTSSQGKTLEKALPDSLIGIDTRMEEMCIREFDEKLMRHTFTCTICSYKTNNRTTFNSHCYSHKPPAFKCGYCPFRANPRCRVTAHIRKYHKEPMIKIINLSNLPKRASDKNPPMTKELFAGVLAPQRKKVNPTKSNKDDTKDSNFSADVQNAGDQVREISNSDGHGGLSGVNKPTDQNEADYPQKDVFHDSMDAFGDEEDLYSSLTFCCHSCSFKTPNIDRFTKHTSLHNFFTHGMKVACMDCSYSTNKILDYEEHISRHMDGFLFYCGCCKFSSIEEQEVREHSLKKHPDRVISIEISPGPSSLSTKWSPVDLDPSVELTDFLAMDCERFYNLISMYGVTMVDLKSTAVTYEDMNDKSDSEDSGTELDITNSGEEEEEKGEALRVKDSAEEPDEDFGVIKGPLSAKKRKADELKSSIPKRHASDNSSSDEFVRDDPLNPMDMSDRDLSEIDDMLNSMHDVNDEDDNDEVNDDVDLVEDNKDDKEDETSELKLKLKTFPHVKYSSDDSDIENDGDIDDDDDIEVEEIDVIHGSDDDVDVEDGSNKNENLLMTVDDNVKEGFEIENDDEDNVDVSNFNRKETETDIKIDGTSENTQDSTDRIEDINKKTVNDNSDNSKSSQMIEKSELIDQQGKERMSESDLLLSDEEAKNDDAIDNSKSSHIIEKSEITDPQSKEIESDYELLLSDKEENKEDKNNDDIDNSKSSPVIEKSELTTDPQSRDTENDLDLLLSDKEGEIDDNDDFLDSPTETQSPFLSLAQTDINGDTVRVDGESDNSRSSQTNNKSDLTDSQTGEMVDNFDMLPTDTDNKTDDFLGLSTENSLPFLSLVPRDSEDSS